MGSLTSFRSSDAWCLWMSLGLDRSGGEKLGLKLDSLSIARRTLRSAGALRLTSLF